MTECINVEQEDVGKRLDVFVLSHFNQYSRSHIKNWIENGNVLINGKAKKAGEKLRLGDSVKIEIIEPKPLDVKAEDIDIDIVYEDEDVAVINKPQNMVVHPANGNYEHTLVNALLFHIHNLSGINGVIRPGIVHRLDKDTSGLLMVAKNDFSHNSLSKQISTKCCKRHYLALVNGNVKENSGIIETYIGRSKKDRKKMAVVQENEGKKAITLFEVKERFGNYTLIDFELKTGRTHQIRVHAAYMGHPIVGDKTYGFSDKFKLEGQLLHAYRIEFDQPTTKKHIVITCDLPEYFKKVLAGLTK